MKVSKIDNQPFESKKFRLPINNMVYTIDGIPIWSKKAHCVKEFSNPNAKELYKKAQSAKDIKEMTKFYTEMGHYEIKEMNFIEKFKSFFNL